MRGNLWQKEQKMHEEPYLSKEMSRRVRRVFAGRERSVELRPYDTRTLQPRNRSKMHGNMW